MQAEETLRDLCEDIGIPKNHKNDRAPEFCGRESSYLKLAKGKRINLTYAEPENYNEIYNFKFSIRDIRKRWHHKMVSKNCPRRVWDFGLKYAAKVIQMIPPEK